MKKQEYIKVESFKEKTTAFICDCCKTEIPTESGYLPKNWVEVTTGHFDWGNDSGESRQDYELCSVQCFKEYLKEDDSLSYKSFYADIEISKDFMDNLLDSIPYVSVTKKV